MDSTPDRGGIPLGKGPAISVARPRWRLWDGLPKTSVCDGRPGQTHPSEIDLAEQLCGARHRIYRGPIRRDLPDQVIVMSEAHLRQLPRAYADYYNDYRTHLGHKRDEPQPQLPGFSPTRSDFLLHHAGGRRHVRDSQSGRGLARTATPLLFYSGAGGTPNPAIRPTACHSTP